MKKQTIRDSAAIILWRIRNGQHQLYLSRRSQNTSFFPGYYAFIGGMVEEQDERDAVSDPYRFCACRELFEETGILLRGASEGQAVRTKLISRPGDQLEKTSFHSMMERHDATLPEHRLEPVGELLTPPFTPRRYHTRFFAVRVPEDQQVSDQHEEIEKGIWMTPKEALNRWKNLEMRIAPPQVLYLRSMAREGMEEAFTTLSDVNTGEEDHEPYIEIRPGVRFLPLETETIPPAETVNVGVVGDERFVVIDPGTSRKEDQHRLVQLIQALQSKGNTFDRILLTHHHPDHVGAVSMLQERFDVPVAAHAGTAESLDQITVNTNLQHGDMMDLGTNPASDTKRQLETIHTPGHTSGHLSFRDTYTKTLIAGDVVAGVGTILITPSEGNMVRYMSTLRDLRQRDLDLVLPAHGPFHDQPEKLFRKYLEHRTMRENKIRNQLEEQPQSLDALLPRVYKGIDEQRWPFAKKSLEAHLIKLKSEGKAREIREEGKKKFCRRASD